MIAKPAAAVVLFEGLDLNLSEYKHAVSKWICMSGSDFRIRWYWSGLQDVKIKEDHCGFRLERRNRDDKDITIWCSFVLIKDRKIIKDGNRYCTFDDGIWVCHYFNLVERDVLKSGEISLEVTICTPSYSLRNKRVMRLKSVVGSLKKEVCLLSGKTSVKANSTLLSISSPVFKAKLDRPDQWLESQENSIDLGKENGMYLKDLVDILEGGEIDLDIRNINHHEKFKSLITLADMWKIEYVLQYILIELTADPSEDDIVQRLRLLTRFKHIPMFHKGARTMTLWAYRNIEQKEFMDLTTEVFLSNSEL